MKGSAEKEQVGLLPIAGYLGELMLAERPKELATGRRGWEGAAAAAALSLARANIQPRDFLFYLLLGLPARAVSRVMSRFLSLCCLLDDLLDQ